MKKIKIKNMVEEDKIKLQYIGKCLLITDSSGKKEEKVLVVGDLHLGYEEVQNKAGVLLSRQMFDEIISDLNLIFGEIGKVDKIILLGDLKHDFGGVGKQEWSDVNRILDYFESMCKKIIVIKGNHDNFLISVLKKRKIGLFGCYIWNGFCFAHGDEDYEQIWEKRIKTLVVGHGHPAILLKEPRGVKKEKYKCFLVGKFRRKNMIVVPSFIEYYIGSDPREGEVYLAWEVNFNNFGVYVVSEDNENLDALDFGRLNKIK